MISWIKKRYHWVIALVMLVELSVIGGVNNNAASLYVIPVTESLNISRASFSLAISINSLVGFVCTAFSGMAYQRLGTKKSLIVGLAIYVGAYTLLSTSNNVFTIAAANALVGVCAALCSTATASRVISDWFVRYQGTVLGLVSAATGIGGSIMCVLLSGIIEGFGWRTSYLVTAFIVILTGVLVIVLVRNRPQDMGLTPYGMDYKPKQKKRHREDAHWLGYTMQELLHKPFFYLTAAVFFLSAVCMYLAFSIVVPHLQSQGMSPSEAAVLNSMLLIFLATFKFLSGSLSDLIGPKWVCAICMVFSGIGLMLLAGVTDVMRSLIAILLYSMGLPVLTVMIPLLTYPLFGYRTHNATLGIFLAMAPLGSLISAPISNVVYDRIGSYTPVLQFAAVLSFVVVGLYCLLYVLAARARAKYEQTTF